MFHDDVNRAAAADLDLSVTALIAPDSAVAARSRRSGCQTTLAGRSILSPDPSRRRREVALPQPWDDVSMVYVPKIQNKVPPLL